MTLSWAGVHPTWRRILEPFAKKVPKKILKESVVPMDRLFQAFKYSGFLNTRVVILGQDPYFAPGKANGLCFGLSEDWIAKNKKDTSSFGNICKEAADWERANLLDWEPDGLQDFTLESWAEQDVLMMNTRLTVAPNKPLSHSGYGWEEATDAVIKTLASRKQPVVFLCLGKEARKAVRKHVSKSSHHTVIATSHPCKYSASRGFLGSGVFGKVNDALIGFGESPIDWCAYVRSSKSHRFG